jgi:hypothetical protein
MRRGGEGFYGNPGLPPWAILFRPFGPRKSSHGDENLGDSSTASGAVGWELPALRAFIQFAQKKLSEE